MIIVAEMNMEIVQIITTPTESDTALLLKTTMCLSMNNATMRPTKAEHLFDTANIPFIAVDDMETTIFTTELKSITQNTVVNEILVITGDMAMIIIIIITQTKLALSPIRFPLFTYHR